MKYEAIESFSGIISMAKGEIRDIPNEALAKDLMKAKLIKKYTPTDEKVLKDELKSANSLINELTEENKMLKEQIEELSTINKESEKTDDTLVSDEEAEKKLSEDEKTDDTSTDNKKNKK